MNSEFLQSKALNFNPPAAHVIDAAPLAAKLVLRLLAGLRHGALRIETPSGAVLHFGDHSLPVTLRLKNWRVCQAALKSGDIGFAESFIDGDWSSDNLPGLIELLIRNRQAIEQAIYGSWLGGLTYRFKHLFQRNSKRGSRKNIHAHYDLGNLFYKLWLDSSMTYSSALFEGDAQRSLAAAQDAKYQRVLSELQLPAGKPQKVLEIGCGWGGFADIAARDAALQITGLTLSNEQLQFARQRLDAAGLTARVDLRLQDYRDTDGAYDGIASIEMFEAVGEQYWPDYFACIARNLKSGARACIQSIVIDHELFARYRNGTDFIQQYIFPGGMLPSSKLFREHAQRHGLQVVNELAFGLDYARTLAEWRSAFHQQLSAVRAQGFDTRFIQTWEFYLAYCEAGFRAGSIDVMQFTLQKS